MCLVKTFQPAKQAPIWLRDVTKEASSVPYRKS